jgi:hypothetical protein
MINDCNTLLSVINCVLKKQNGSKVSTKDGAVHTADHISPVEAARTREEERATVTASTAEKTWKAASLRDAESTRDRGYTYRMCYGNNLDSACSVQQLHLGGW